MSATFSAAVKNATSAAVPRWAYTIDSVEEEGAVYSKKDTSQQICDALEAWADGYIDGKGLR